MEEKPKYIEKRVGLLGQFAYAIDNYEEHRAPIVSKRKVKNITGPTAHSEAIKKYLKSGGKVTRLGPAYAEDAYINPQFAEMRESSYNE